MLSFGWVVLASKLHQWRRKLGLLEPPGAIDSGRARLTLRYVSSTMARTEWAPKASLPLNAIGGPQAPIYPTETLAVLRNARAVSMQTCTEPDFVGHGQLENPQAA